MHSVQRQPEHTGSCICTMEMLLIPKAFFFFFFALMKHAHLFHIVKETHIKKKGGGKSDTENFFVLYK